MPDCGIRPEVRRGGRFTDRIVSARMRGDVLNGNAENGHAPSSSKCLLIDRLPAYDTLAMQ